ncbi:putative nucleotide-binding protein [Tepidicaulis marinus]|uniref:Nucleotide-binding protein M2A_2976 n=1 Tax=Tepidicaulis marinus TaxID=1333998 RepID=A0A081BEK9_9HYPH|nr:YajQ family cyclic di-GMP-binding protein [Tepidicaulis marinus]GAK46477.1 putative nucleotide-binding protein [Tepidicaulis marinus]
MPSFDVVSKVDLSEVDNAIQNVRREIEQRYDFKGSKCSLERNDEELVILADDELKLKQMHEVLQGHLAKRGIEPSVLDYKPAENAAGQSQRQKVGIKQGLSKELAKKLVKEIKDKKLKVQVAIQGDELRVTGKKRDDLQDVIQHLKTRPDEQPLQYVNFRD